MRKSLPIKVRLRAWWISYSQREYWPSWLTYGPTALIWFIQALLARDPFFFVRVNPAIPTGGWLGESKWDIQQILPKETLPNTAFIPKGTDQASTLSLIEQAHITFPCIVKPDIGERGFLVKIIGTRDELHSYLEETQIDMIVQNLITYPLELSALCYQMPDTGELKLTSLCIKDFLKVTGDGTSTLEQLVRKDDRALLQYSILRERFAATWETVLPKGESMLLEPIGNHCLGTRFVDVNDQIDDALTSVLGGILQEMEGVYFGRFDLRTTSLTDLKAGKNFKIFEFNGVGSDPAHIYDARHSIGSVYAVIWKHFGIMRRIHEVQRSKGVPSMTFAEIVEAVFVYRKYKREAGKFKME